MSPDQQGSISAEGLNYLYRDLGEARHAVFERNVRILHLEEQGAKKDARIAELEAQVAPEDGDTVDSGG